MILNRAGVRASLVAGLAASGAPGGQTVSATGGTYNPVHVLIDGLADVLPAVVNAAAATSRWWPTPPNPPFPYPGVPGPISPGVSPLPALLPVEYAPLAAKEAATLSWNGPAASVLFVGAYMALQSALARSPARLTSVDPALAGAPVGQLVQLRPSPLVPAVLAGQLQAAWARSPHFAGGQPERRIPLSLGWARVCAEAWSRVRPLAIVPGVVGGVPSPTGYLLTVVA